MSKSTPGPVTGRGINMEGFKSDDYQGRSMTVPERSVLDGTFDSEAGEKELPLDLKGNGVDFETYMGGRATPPRTLTVDDTSFVEKPGGERPVLKNTEKTKAASDR